MTTRQGSLAAHTREDHDRFGDPNTWSIDDRIGARQTCALCRLIFNEGGGWTAEGPSSIRVQGHATMRVPRRRPSESTILPFYPATPGQLDFLGKLTKSRQLTPGAEAEVAKARIAWKEGKLSKAKASSLIELLKPLPYLIAAKQPEGRRPWPKVAAGRYALYRDQLPGDYKNEVNFFKVDRPTDGPFAGRTFVKLMASDDTFPVRGEAARLVLEAIAKSPTEALKLYGQKVGSCGHCGRTLTDDESRAFGIGPKCRSKLGL